MNHIEHIHQSAVRAARQFRRSEFELVEAIGKVYSKRVYSQMGYTSLFDYCTKALFLSEGNAYNFTSVAKKALEIPEIQIELKKGNLTVCKARRLVSVITPVNKSKWIEVAKKSTNRELEHRVACVKPRTLVKEGIRPVARDTVEGRFAFTPAIEAKL